MLGVVLSALTCVFEGVHASEHTSTEPYSVFLDKVLFDFDRHFGLLPISSEVVELLHSLVNNSLEVLGQPFVEACEKGATSGEDDVLVQFGAVVNRARLN